MAQSTELTRGSLVKFALLPGILPRLGHLLGGGFANFSYFMAIVFNMLRILPDEHLYLKSYNRGNYSIIQVLVAAANHIEFNRKNLDKVTIFFVMIGGVVMLVLQIILMIITIFTSKAMAYAGPGPGPQTLGEFFTNPNPSDDIAFRMLDLVFGVQGVFHSREMANVPTPFHEGLHALFQFYSYGILLVGTFVIIYLVATIVLETANTGTPFGERFNRAWAPVRLILFFGLLIPTATGLNLAQVIVLEAAKLGSNVATNGWLTFDRAVEETPYLGTAEELIAAPTAPDLASLVSFMQFAKTCQVVENGIYSETERPEIRGYVVFDEGTTGSRFYELSSAPAFADLARQGNSGTIFIRFGVQDTEKYAGEMGTVYPFCGELMLTVVDMAQPGATVMQQGYLDLVTCFWRGALSGAEPPTPEEYISGVPEGLADRFSCGNLGAYGEQRAHAYFDTYAPGSNVEGRLAWVETTLVRSQVTKVASNYIDEIVNNARDEQVANGDWINDAALQMGWAGAGIWFNKIAEQNGALTAAVIAKPEITLMPSVMEYVKKTKLAHNVNTPMDEYYTPVLADNAEFPFNPPQDRDIAEIMSKIFNFWGNEDNTAYFRDRPETHNAGMTGNIIIDMINVLMGTRGLFDMCKQTNVHPLAQLSSLGKGLVEHSIRAFAMSAGSAGLGALLQQQNWSHVLEAASGFFLRFAVVGLSLGFILFYVIPFMPFIYFFFAVMTWVKSIFEAMVAMPLWALAHLHIDGEGMPGPAASQGYFHILEIFLRPICILIGLLGGIAIFAAMVKVLNQIFYLLVSNMTGHWVEAGATDSCFTPPGMGANAENDPQQEDFLGNTIDEFFYTAVYAIIVYLIAIPCFKMVDLVPDHIMRWLGTGINSFGSQDGDAIEGVIRNITIGVGGIGNQMSGGMDKAVKSMKGG